MPQKSETGCETLIRWGASEWVINFHWMNGNPIENPKNMGTDTFTCVCRGEADMVNAWVQHCLNKGYTNFVMDSFFETRVNLF